MISDSATVHVSPMDEHNRSLIDNVHPPAWKNPQPSGRYNLVVIGAGTAGLVTAAIAATLGAKVALIERHLMGGDCLNVGCVPSKAMIGSARVWSAVHNARAFGMTVPETVEPDFGAVMERMRRLRAGISPVDSARRFTELGVDVYLGSARFTGGDTVTVDGRTLRFARAAICTGARATALPIPGLSETGFLTNETVFSLTELPRRLAVVGGGPIGCELAQAFARFGSGVTLLERGGRILSREDADAADIVAASMARDGVRLVHDATIDGVRRSNDGKQITYRAGAAGQTIAVDEILIGVGRAPNVEDLGLEVAGVDYDTKRGVRVDDRLRTTNPRIYAAGDVCFPLKFTHAADAMAQIVVRNALFPHPFGIGYAGTGALIIPWCTYTSPEVAHVGLYDSHGAEGGVESDTFTVPMDEIDRAILDGETAGFGRVHVARGSDRILGATIVANRAGELISQFTLAMRNGLGLGALGGTIYPYPTQAELARKLANAWRRTTLTPPKQRLLRRLFAWMR